MSSPFRLVEPAPRSAVLALAGARAHVRRKIYLQGRLFPTTAVYRRGDLMAVAFFRAQSCGRLEFALSVSPDAAPHMRSLIRLAHQTLEAVRQSHLVFAKVDPANLAGVRMARLTGFEPSRAGPDIWIFQRSA